MCRERDSNPHDLFGSRDFKSLVSTNSTIAACGQLNKSGTKVRDFVDIREDRWDICCLINFFYANKMTNENKRHLFNGLLVVGCRLLVVACWLSVAGLDCPVTRVTQWLAGAHETDILTDNRKPITNNRQPPPYKCLRKKSRARFWAGR